jgi:hypothetical protein
LAPSNRPSLPKLLTIFNALPTETILICRFLISLAFKAKNTGSGVSKQHKRQTYIPSCVEKGLHQGIKCGAILSGPSEDMLAIH